MMLGSQIFWLKRSLAMRAFVHQTAEMTALWVGVVGDRISASVADTMQGFVRDALQAVLTCLLKTSLRRRICLSRSAACTPGIIPGGNKLLRQGSSPFLSQQPQQPVLLL